MLSLEIIVVLGLLYCFFMYATLKVKHAKERAREEVKREEIRSAQEKLAEEISVPVSVER
jgi:hypothetical protein